LVLESLLNPPLGTRNPARTQHPARSALNPIHFILIALVLSLAACRGWFRETPTVPYTIPPKLDDGWETGSLEQAEIDRARSEQLTGTIRSRPEFNVHAVLIEHDGRLVYEEYFDGKDEKWGVPLRDVTHTRDMRHDLRSVTKSVVSALVGVAAASGAIKSLDAPLLDYFPEYHDLQVPARRQITIRHALSMSAGLEWDEDVPYNNPKNDEIAMGRSADPIRYVLAREIVAAPGTTWRYNGGTTQVLGAIVQRATGTPLAEYAQSVLWSPLGVTDVEWLGNLSGLPSAASGLRLRPRDLAKFGSLYLHDGQWNGRQVVPSAWVRESTRRQITFPGQTDRGYAYLWWHTCARYPAGPIETPTAIGNGLQRIFLLRAQKTVVTFLSGRYNNRGANPPDQLMREFIVPALPRTPGAACP
jgi:CubicO group peptidase (beta-lactamase class C family)